MQATAHLLLSPLRLPQPQPEPSDTHQTGVTGASDATPVLWMLCLPQQSQGFLRAIIIIFFQLSSWSWSFQYVPVSLPAKIMD